MDVIVGTAGHIDHGKTSLVKALTGTDADRLPEEKRRGITVDIGFAEMSVGDTHIGFVDVPGHERFVKNMLAGASGIDIVILVIAADDGVMPQTREHFDICRLLNVRSGLIAITKCDLVDDETLELAKLEAAELVENSFLEFSPIIAVSSQKGDGIEEIRDALSHAACALQERQIDRVMRLPIDRSFSMKGFGAVVTGTLASGEITEGSEFELLPASQKVRVRGLQTHGKSVASARAGQRVAVNLAGVDHHEIERGMMLAELTTLIPTQIIDTEIEVLSGSPKPLRSRQRVRFHIGTTEVLARVSVLNDGGEIVPGGLDLVQLTMEKPIVAIPNERFIIRSYSPQMTIGGGVVIDNLASKHRRKDLVEVRRFLNGLLSSTKADTTVEVLINASNAAGLTFADLQARTGLAATVLKSAVQSVIKSGAGIDSGGRYIAMTVFRELETSAVEAVEVFHNQHPLAKGITRETLRETSFAYLPNEIFQAVITSLEAAKKIVTTDDTIKIARYEKVLSAGETSVSDRIRILYKSRGLEVPRLDEAINESIAGTNISVVQARKLVQIFLDSRELVKVTEEFYFAGEVITGLIGKLKKYAENSTDRLVDVSTFKELAGISRKYAIPLLEYFDRVKVTVRAGEKRVIL
ncbi:MAG: selenocysteine-specific translation elongation factor [Pyrinomonadaceae bacterium]|nr:selenocysteine-specific translation elongation factor [Pyrinomonadaceae bacterium]